jgi:hypothetical protein
MNLNPSYILKNVEKHETFKFQKDSKENIEKGSLLIDTEYKEARLLPSMTVQKLWLLVFLERNIFLSVSHVKLQNGWFVRMTNQSLNRFTPFPVSFTKSSQKTTTNVLSELSL